MNTVNFNKAVSALNALTQEELNALVPVWKNLSKTKRSVEGAKAITEGKINIGDVVYWDSTKRSNPGRHYMKVLNFNRALTCVVGYESDMHGNKFPINMKWTVGLSMVKKVELRTYPNNEVEVLLVR